MNYVYISGAVHDVIRRLSQKYPEVMSEFLLSLSLFKTRSGMPGATMLNGPQVDKVWRNLDLLHKMLMEKGDPVIAEGSIDYLKKLQSLYFMCVRYLVFLLLFIHKHLSSIPVKRCLEIMLRLSRNLETRLITCMHWGFFLRLQRYMCCILTWRPSWTSRPRTTGGPNPWPTARAWRRATQASRKVT